MTVKSSDVISGKCFVTTSQQVRRVIQVQGDQVQYESRGSSSSMEFGNRVSVAIEKFVAAVEREVRCDWDKNYPESNS